MVDVKMILSDDHPGNNRSHVHASPMQNEDSRTHGRAGCRSDLLITGITTLPWQATAS